MSSQLFGELRGILHESFDDKQWFQRRMRFTTADPKVDWLNRLTTLLHKVYNTNTELYTQTWLPYLASFDDMWRIRTFDVQTVKQLEQDLRWASFAYMALCVHHRWSHMDDSEHAFSTPAMARLTDINLSYTRCDDYGIKWLVKHEHLYNVQHLYLHQCDIGQVGLKHLSEASHFKSLSVLYMSDNLTGYYDTKLNPLIDSELLTQLHVLDLGKNLLHAKDLESFVQSPSIANLTTLDLSENDLGNRGLELLANTPYLHNLQKLMLNQTNATNEGMLALANSPYLASLTHLNVRSNDIGTKAILALANAPHLASLIELGINGNISDDAKEALAQSPYLCNNIKHKYKPQPDN